MKHIWERDILNPSNCRVCPHDEAYFMPMRANSILNLHLPFGEFTGIISTIYFDTKVYWTDLEGNIVLGIGGMSNYNGQSLVFGQVQDGRYDIYVPTPCGDYDVGSDRIYQIIVVTASPGTKLWVDQGGVRHVFTIGEPSTHPVYQISATQYAITFPDGSTSASASNLASIGGSYSLVGQMTSLYGNDIERIIPDCVRILVRITIGGVEHDFYTVPFKCVECSNEDEVIQVEGLYPNGMVDCNLMRKDTSFRFGNTPTSFQGGLMLHKMNIFGYTKIKSPKFNIKYAANCFHNSSSVIYRSNLYGRAIPMDWLIYDLSSIFMAQNVLVEGEVFRIEGDAITEEQGLELTEFQYLNVPLQKCDCTVNFVC